MTFSGKNSSLGSRRLSGQTRAFSLVELLVVMAIIAILITLGGPSLVGVFKGSALTQGGQLIQDQLNFYRQDALAKNRPVEVRIYKYIDPNIPGDPGYYRAMQPFAVTSVIGNGTVTYTKTAISKPVRLPASIIIDGGRNLSPLITTCLISGGANGPGYQASPPATDVPPIPKLTNYSYVYFQFNQDGSTNFPVTGNGPWVFYLTVHQSSYGDSMSAATIKNKNYYTIQVDPNNGHTYIYRP